MYTQTGKLWNHHHLDDIHPKFYIVANNQEQIRSKTFFYLTVEHFKFTKCNSKPIICNYLNKCHILSNQTNQKNESLNIKKRL